MKQCHLLRAATWARYDNRLKRSGADCVYGRIPVELEIRRDIRRPTLPQILAEFGAGALLYDRGHGWKREYRAMARPAGGQVVPQPNASCTALAVSIRSCA